MENGQRPAVIFNPALPFAAEQTVFVQQFCYCLVTTYVNNVCYCAYTGSCELLLSWLGDGTSGVARCHEHLPWAPVSPLIINSSSAMNVCSG